MFASAKCKACSKSVYRLDPHINLDGSIFHKSCAKCSDCHCQITLSNFVKSEGVSNEVVLFCKTHYLKRFKEGGHYLGEEKYHTKTNRAAVNTYQAARTTLPSTILNKPPQNDAPSTPAPLLKPHAHGQHQNGSPFSLNGTPLSSSSYDSTPRDSEQEPESPTRPNYTQSLPAVVFGTLRPGNSPHNGMTRVSSVPISPATFRAPDVPYTPTASNKMSSPSLYSDGRLPAVDDTPSMTVKERIAARIAMFSKPSLPSPEKTAKPSPRPLSISGVWANKSIFVTRKNSEGSTSGELAQASNASSSVAATAAGLQPSRSSGTGTGTVAAAIAAFSKTANTNTARNSNGGVAESASPRPRGASLNQNHQSTTNTNTGAGGVGSSHYVNQYHTNVIKAPASPQQQQQNIDTGNRNGSSSAHSSPGIAATTATTARETKRPVSSSAAAPSSAETEDCDTTVVDTEITAPILAIP